ncbi:small ribosomal subunit protein uS19-like [Camelus bactrianus]|uniref:Small ribosomal subunit protein uS19-like n=1 Tax=Camelus bactrianus TaxID=9837 RepID=A0AC58QN82_CAMBA
MAPQHLKCGVTWTSRRPRRCAADAAEQRARRRLRGSSARAEPPAQAEKEAPPTEKPQVVKTHLRTTIILPETVGAYNCKTFNQVEIKPEMIGHY